MSYVCLHLDLRPIDTHYALWCCVRSCVRFSDGVRHSAQSQQHRHPSMPLLATIRIWRKDYRVVATAPPDVGKIGETSNKYSECQCIWWRTAWRQKFFRWRPVRAARSEQLWCSHSFERTMTTSKNIPENEAIFIFIIFYFWLIAFVYQMEILCLHLPSRWTRQIFHIEDSHRLAFVHTSFCTL